METLKRLLTATDKRLPDWVKGPSYPWILTLTGILLVFTQLLPISFSGFSDPLAVRMNLAPLSVAIVTVGVALLALGFIWVFQLAGDLKSPLRLILSGSLLLALISLFRSALGPGILLGVLAVLLCLVLGVHAFASQIDSRRDSKRRLQEKVASVLMVLLVVGFLGLGFRNGRIVRNLENVMLAEEAAAAEVREAEDSQNAEIRDRALACTDKTRAQVADLVEGGDLAAQSLFLEYGARSPRVQEIFQYYSEFLTQAMEEGARTASAVLAVKIFKDCLDLVRSGQPY